MAGSLQVMESTVRVTRDGQTSEYIVEEEHEDGSLLIRPETELERMHHRHGGRPLTPEEFDELIVPHVGPADGEA